MASSDLSNILVELSQSKILYDKILDIMNNTLFNKSHKNLEVSLTYLYEIEEFIRLLKKEVHDNIQLFPNYIIKGMSKKSIQSELLLNFNKSIKESITILLKNHNLLKKLQFKHEIVSLYNGICQK
jgi:hypothetical protein